MMTCVQDLSPAELAQVEGGAIYLYLNDVIVSGAAMLSSFQWGIGR
jgi:hypothetical protein